jgi:hypothetical protein
MAGFTPDSTLARFRTLRAVAEGASRAAEAALRGDELGVAVLPYMLLGLERGISLQLPRSPLQGEIGALVHGGVQDAMIIGHRVQTLARTLLAELADREARLGYRVIVSN